MRKTTMNRLVAMVVALLLAALVPMGAMAEDFNITTPTDLAPVETEAENASNVTEEPQGAVRIVMLNEGPLYYGDEVALRAEVDNVDEQYTVTWQVKVDIDEWENVATGLVYRFTLTPENAGLEYRVVLNVAE